MTSRNWKFIGGNATEKQRNYLDRLAPEGGMIDGPWAASNYLGISSAKLSKKGLDRADASKIIDWLKAKIEEAKVPSAKDDPEVRALKGGDAEVEELRKMAGLR